VQVKKIKEDSIEEKTITEEVNQVESKIGKSELKVDETPEVKVELSTKENDTKSNDEEKQNNN